MFRYLNVREDLYSEEFGKYTSFGILILKKVDRKWIEENFFSDVSLNADVVNSICNVAFSNQIKPEKIMDLIEMFI